MKKGRHLEEFQLNETTTFSFAIDREGQFTSCQTRLKDQRRCKLTTKINDTSIAIEEPPKGSDDELIQSINRGQATVDAETWPLFQAVLETLRTDSSLARWRWQARNDAQEGRPLSFPAGATPEQVAAFRIAYAEEREQLLLDPE